MNTTISLGANIRYDYQKKEDKHFFGGYFNLAQNNIESAESLFRERFGAKFDDGFKKELSYAEWENRITYLQQYLPIVNKLRKPVNDPLFDSLPSMEKEKTRRKQFRDNLTLVMDTMNKLRNFYTHFQHDNIIINNAVFILLDSLLLEVTKEVKRKRKATDKTKQLLKTKLKEEYQQLIAAKYAKLVALREEDKRISLAPDQLHNAVLNDAFKHLLYKEKENGEVSLSKYYKSKMDGDATGDNAISLTRNGLVFLTCLFLTKKQGEDFRSRITGFKGKTGEEGKINSLRNMATHWVFSYLSFRESRAKVTTAFEKETLLAQMADELSKVPDEIYQTLSSDNKAEFLEDMNEYVKDGNETESLLEATVIHPIIRKRYDNRFHYLAVRFLDEFAHFPSLRFQVHLGNYVHDRRTKSIAGTNFETERVVKEPVKVFGKLSELTKAKNDYWIANQPENTKWERYPAPSYYFVGNNIQIQLTISDIGTGDSGKDLDTQLTELKAERDKRENRTLRHKHKTKKIVMEREVVKKLSQKAPSTTIALLSLNELPALLHELLVKNATGEALEKILLTKLSEHVKEVQDYSGGKTTSARISKKMTIAKEEDNKDIDKLIKKIKHELSDITKRENDLKERQKLVEGGKRNRTFRNAEMGSLAVWLAADLIHFMPLKAREQWRGHHHSHLQQTLAFYDTRRDEAKVLVQSFWKMDNWDGHFKELFHQKTVEGYLTNYLISKKKLLEMFLMQIEQHRENSIALKKVLKDIEVYIPRREFIIRSLNYQKITLLARPLVFPRGIFDSKPTFIKGKRPDTHPELFADWYTYAQCKSHQQQSFYAMPRDYQELLAIEKQQDSDFSENKKKLTPAAQMDLLKMKQDLKIKKVKMQDVFLKDMTLYMIEKILGNAPALTLADFYLTQTERKQMQQQAATQTERTKGERSENVHNESFIWGKIFPFQCGQLQEEKVKLKDIGKYKRYAEEQKVQVVFSYNPTKVWTRQQLMDELELKANSYEVVRREHLLKDVQHLEDWILQNSGVPEDSLKENNSPKFKHYIIKGLLAKHSLSTTLQEVLLKESYDRLSADKHKDRDEHLRKAILLIMIRNKFAHNQLPATDWLQEALHHCPWQPTDQTYSQYYLRVFTELAAILKT